MTFQEACVSGDFAEVVERYVSSASDYLDDLDFLKLTFQQLLRKQTDCNQQNAKIKLTVSGGPI